MNDNKNIPEVMQLSRRQFYATDFRELDRALSVEEQAEWNAIYASYDSHSLLHGTVIGVEPVSVPDSADGTPSSVSCLVIVQYRVKVLLPGPLIWMPGEERAPFVANSMVGAQVDYIIQGVDRAGGCAVASRAQALERQRWHAREVLHIRPGEIVDCMVLAVGASHLTLTAHGYDVTLAQAGLSWSYLGDLRESYHAGQTLRARVLDIDGSALALSVRDAAPNPYDGAALRHPAGSTRLARLTSKYAGGVFGRLPDGCTVVCGYAQHFSDAQFQVGDTVLVQITGCSDGRQWLRGKIRGRLS